MASGPKPLNPDHRRAIMWWSITIAYILCNYAMLGYMPAIWRFIAQGFPGGGYAFQYTLYSLLGAICCYFILTAKPKRSIAKYLLLVAFLAIYGVMYHFEKNPGEKIHMAQYGVLGIVLFRTLGLHFSPYKPKFYFYGALICITAGAVDEAIQGILPNRSFTWHDVAINGASGILAILMIRIYLLPGQKSA